jgi:hypothetical protein
MEACLLLGVFHSRKFDHRREGKEPNRGQGYRDGVRSKALEDLGYLVRSLDDKHSEPDVQLGEEIHCNANFADTRRMMKAIRKTFGHQLSFDHVVLDYFFSPVSNTIIFMLPISSNFFQYHLQISWARDRWTNNFWKLSLPQLAEQNIIKKGGKVWLPNLECVLNSINDFHNEIYKYYTWEAVENPFDNPLYAATEMVTEQLLRCPDIVTNATQILPLLINNSYPFLVLTCREVFLDIPCLIPCAKNNYNHSRTLTAVVSKKRIYR